MKDKIAIICGGLDDTMRGYETHTRLLFDSLSEETNVNYQFILFKGSGKRAKNEKILRAPSRTSRIVKFLAKFRGGRIYWESIFFALRFIFCTIIRNDRFSKILCIQPMVSKTLMRCKKLLPGKPIIIFTHGVWIEPHEYVKMGDEFHQVNIENYCKQKKYFKANNINKKVYLIPHFIPDITPIKISKAVLRKKYNIKTEKVLLSVGRIDRAHKNMEYVIKEAAKLPEDWSLVLCGGIGEADLLDIGRNLLGNRFIHIFLPREKVPEIYAMADLFVLGSLQEGFGIVTLEAMRAGLPIILHDRELFRWILKDDSVCVVVNPDDVEKLPPPFDISDRTWVNVPRSARKNIF